MGLDDARGDVVVRVIADRLDFPAQAQTALHGFEEFTHDGAVSGNFHLDASVAVEVDDGEGLAGFGEDVLGYVEGALVAFGAEGAAFAVGVVGVCAGSAVRGVAREGFHYVEFVVVGEAGVGCWDGSEADLAGAAVGRHFGGKALRAVQAWWVGYEVVVGCLGVLGRQLDLGLRWLFMYCWWGCSRCMLDSDCVSE